MELQIDLDREWVNNIRGGFYKSVITEIDNINPIVIELGYFYAWYYEQKDIMKYFSQYYSLAKLYYNILTRLQNLAQQSKEKEYWRFVDIENHIYFDLFEGNIYEFILELNRQTFFRFLTPQIAEMVVLFKNTEVVEELVEKMVEHHKKYWVR